MQILPMIRGVDQHGVVQIGLGEQPGEKLPDIPQQRVLVGVAVQHPIVGLAIETVTFAGVRHFDKLSARQRRTISHEPVRVFVVYREMRADLIDYHQLRFIVVEQFDQLRRRGHVAVAHAGLIELHELIDVVFLRVVHQVLQIAAGALRVDIDRAQPGLFRVLPDRRQRAVDAYVIGARAAITQGNVGVGTAVGDRGGVAVVENLDPGMRFLEVAVHPERRVDVQVVAGNALVDDQHNVVVHRLIGARQAHRFAWANGVKHRFIGEQIQIGQWRVHLRQAPGAFTRAHEQHRAEQKHPEQRCRDQQRTRHRPASTRLEADAQQ
ncbi:hypothetical protein D3C76_1044290 [compost metagenome]